MMKLIVYAIAIIPGAMLIGAIIVSALARIFG